MTPDGGSARSSGAPPWTLALAGALLAGGPIWHELWTARYPFDRGEAWLLPLAFAAAGAAVALLSHMPGRIAGSLVFGGLVFAFVDLQFNPQAWTYIAVVALGCVAVSALLWTHRGTLVALALGAFYVTSIGRPPIAPRAPRTTTSVAQDSNPVIVHVILDEMGGIGGLRAGGDTSTADFLRQFYRERGFTVYEGAYSRYEITSASIPHALALGAEPAFRPDSASRPYIKSLSSNPYFAALRQRGFDIRVFQTTYFDYCRAADAPVVSCDVENGNSIRNFAFLAGGALRRASRVARFYLATRSHVYQKLRPHDDVWRRSVMGSAIAGIRALTDSIGRGPRGGVVYFAHFLMPHRPTDVDAECRVLPSMGDRFDYPSGLSAAEYRQALDVFGGQVRCTHRLLATMIATIDRTIGRDRAIILIHGDHGVRFRQGRSGSETLSALEPADLVAKYPTLFALRIPGGAGATHTEAVPLQDLVWEVARGGFAPVTRREWEHFVRLVPEKTGVTDTVRYLRESELPWGSQPTPFVP